MKGKPAKYTIYEEYYTRNFDIETRPLYSGAIEEQMLNLYDGVRHRRKTRDTIRIFLADRDGNVIESTDS